MYFLVNTFEFVQASYMNTIYRNFKVNSSGMGHCCIRLFIDNGNHAAVAHRKSSLVLL